MSFDLLDVTNIILNLIIIYVLIRIFVYYIQLKPKNIGIADNKLRDCPKTPNCVNSQSGIGYSKIEPFKRKEGEDIASAVKRVKEALLSLPRTKIVKEEANYLHAECRSFFFGFVDDVEFFFPDDSDLIHFRSAARLGNSDVGMNRKRMEKLRSLLNQV